MFATRTQLTQLGVAAAGTTAAYFIARRLLTKSASWIDKAAFNLSSVDAETRAASEAALADSSSALSGAEMGAIAGRERRR